MPFYEYALPDGTVVVRYARVAERDAFPGRITAPSSLRVTVCTRGEPTQAEEVLAGFHAYEEKDPRAHDVMREGLGMSPAQIKAAWAKPAVDYVEPTAEQLEAANAAADRAEAERADPPERVKRAQRKAVDVSTLGQGLNPRGMSRAKDAKNAKGKAA